MCCVCKFCIVFALLPAQCAVCVSPLLCLLNVLPVQFAMRGLQVLIILLFLCTTASAVCCACKSYVVFVLLQHSVLCL